jgi:hypothetical protein
MAAAPPTGNDTGNAYGNNLEGDGDGGRRPLPSGGAGFLARPPCAHLKSGDEAANDFDADAVVYDLIEEFYAAFGFDPESIPLFDEEHHFQP